MVFESIVADLLNRYLGDFVENLDRSQLKIGIWGGDVVLNNLALKQSALDELNLPIRTIYGYLGKLVLKIPWKNLYTAPVEAHIDQLYLLAVPNLKIKYNPEKEEKWLQDQKQSELKKYEEAKKKELEKDKPKTNDTFTEKLAAQIIRSVQISIKNIHIRYEDNFNRPEKPYSLGVTLHSFYVRSINSWGEETNINPLNLIFKELVLECLSVYWNPSCDMFYDPKKSKTDKEYKELFEQGIATKQFQPECYQYFLGPINSAVNLRFNTKPEVDGTNFTTPKLLMKFEMESLSIRVGRAQFQDVLVLIDALNRMKIQMLYRKFRPDLNSYKGHYKDWWQFAYKCIVETEIKRRKDNWNLYKILEHREICKEYAQAYRGKVSTAKPSADSLKVCSRLEERLDVLNIILIREKIEMEVARDGKVAETSTGQSGGGGWLRSWWSGGQKVDSPQPIDDITAQIQNAMTPGEKEKLFRAIDYQEGAKPTVYPAQFVFLDLNILLHELQFIVFNEALNEPNVLSIKISGLSSRIQQRPTKNNLAIDTLVGVLSAIGCKQGDIVPRIVEPKPVSAQGSITSLEPSLFKCLIELNPLESECSTRINVRAMPLRIVYDAVTINSILNVFTLDGKKTMQPIQQAASMKLAQFRQKSTLGLQYVIDNHEMIDLHIDMMASHVILPKNGFFNKEETGVLVLNLGRFEFYSKPRKQSSVKVKELHSLGHSEEEILAQVMSQSYDNFELRISDLQMLFALEGENWDSEKAKVDNEIYLLKPTSILMNLASCIIHDDPRLPKIKLDAQLPNIEFNLVEQRVIELISLMLTIPMPETQAPPSPSSPHMKGAAVLGSTNSLAGSSLPARPPTPSKLKPQQAPEDLVQFTEAIVNFELKNFSISVSRLIEEADLESLLNFQMISLEASLEKKTFDLEIGLRLGGLSMVQMYESKPIRILNTPMASGFDDYLFTIKYVNVDRLSPEFHSKHNSVLQLISIEFTKLDVLFHQEAIIYLIHLSNGIQTRITELLEAKEKKVYRERIAGGHPRYTRVLSKITEEGGLIQATKSKSGRVVKKKGAKRVEVVELKVNIEMKSIWVELANVHCTLATLGVSGGTSVVTLKKSYTQVEASLVGVFLNDPNCHKYSKVITVVDKEEALVVKLVIFNDEDRSSRKADISVKASMARVRVVFLNKFIVSLTEFLNNFQTAQNVIIDATQAAAEKAKLNVQDAYQNAVRVLFDIKVKAPIILVPVNSRSAEAFLLDLGFLIITNSIVDVVTARTERPAALDNIQLELQSLKLSKVIVTDELGIDEERLILKPISFKLTVQRNLSSSWYDGAPQLEIGGKLHTIHVTIFQRDYNMVFKILNENIGDVGRSSTKSSLKNSSQIKQIKSKPSQEKRPPSPSTVTKEKSCFTEKAQTAIKFYFTLESLVIELFSGNPDEANSIEGLGEFKLLVISTKGSILTDGSMQISLLLLDCILDDIRPSQEGKIKRYMERKSDESKEVGDVQNTMIDVTYQQKRDAMFVDLRVSSFILILNIDHLMKIASLFSPDVELKKSVDVPPPVVKRGRSYSTHHMMTVKEEESQPPSMMTINVKLEHPDIILVESLDDINTNALILQAELVFKFRVQEASKFLNGTIQDFQLYSCAFNPTKRNRTKAPVLRPVTFMLNGSTPLKKGLHIDICTTDIRLSVSADIIQVLNNVYTTITASNVIKESESLHDVDNSNMWKITPFEESQFIFLSTEIGEEALQEHPLESEISLPPGDESEICMFAIPSIVITVEAGSGVTTIPMLLFESSLQAAIRDWSTQMSVDAQLTAKLSYYNDSLALWEPLIEPVENIQHGQFSFVSWELTVQVETHKDSQGSSLSSTFNSKIRHPEMCIYISSKEVMSITITKTCLEVLNTLSSSFTEAIYKPSEKISIDAQFILINDTGYSITVFLENSDFELFRSAADDLTSVISSEIKEVLLDSGARVELSTPDKDFQPQLSSTNADIKDLFISIKVNELNCLIEIPVMRSDKRFFMLNQRGTGKDPWGLVSHVKVTNGSTHITLRTILQITNWLSVPVNTYYMTAKGNEIKLVGTIEPLQQLNLPLDAVYTPTSELFFSVLGYTVSIVPFVWKDLQRSLEKTVLLQCNPKNKEDKEPFFIKAIGEIEQVYFGLTSRHTMASNCYNIQLRSAVIVRNLLPVDVICCVQGVAVDKPIKSGELLQIPTAEPGSSSLVLRITDYLDREWSSKNEISANPAEFSVWTFESYESHKFTLDLGMHTVNKGGSFLMSLYCPFWMVNNTGLMLSYRRSSKVEKEKGQEQSDDWNNVLYHPKNFNKPIMFSFHAKSFFAKKKATVRVEDGQWSDKFSLDVAGSSGVVNCKFNDQQYQIVVNIKLTSNTLTKQVSFTPLYVLINNCSFGIEVKEYENSQAWLLVEPNDCLPFWPINDRGHFQMRIQSTSETTIPTMFSQVHNSVLKVKNKYGAVNVDIQLTMGRVHISLFPYEYGMAPALIINHTHKTIDFWDKSDKRKGFYLKPMEKVLFTWETSEENHVLEWNLGKESHCLTKDDIGEFSLQKDQDAYWVSFLYGLQRVLLLTTDPIIAEQAQNVSDFDIITREIDISIHGFGISLVDNISRVEVLYLSVTSSGVIWEAKKKNKKRYKQLSSNDSSKLEEAYAKYSAAIQAGETPKGLVNIDSRIQVDFDNLEMMTPVNKNIQRRYSTGMWLHFKSSPRQLQFHAKINRVQIDNQMLDCVFPVVLSPVPPPKSITLINHKPSFIELSIVKRLNSYSGVQQYKYFKLLIQEFHVKVDIGFINALVKEFEAGEVSDDEKMANFVKDKQAATDPLIKQVVIASSQDQKNFYDILHLSPLKIHLSFSLSSGGSSDESVIPEFLHIFSQSFGVTLTDVQDVVFKLAYFERQYTFMTQRQLATEVQSHYLTQLLRQLYVLVLGLDVIGNPFGLFMGFTQGATDLFYEPFQGAIQGPGEFAEGLMLGVRSLFGHTVGGAAGAFSKITGAMGKGLAALTFDKDYQRQRREAMSNRPQNVQEGLAQSGKGLVMGVVEGVGGVITKPITGAKEEGIQGFFKGVGKGMMGLVTRPTAGVIDFASGSLSAVKRATDTSEEVTRIRCPRYFDTDGLVRPYSRLQAEGNKLLVDLEKGKYLATDMYVFHMPIGQGKHKDMLLLTDQRIAYLSHNELFGGYQLEWSHTWQEMSGPPKVVAQGVALPITDKKKGVKFFSAASAGKVLLIYDDQTKKFLVEKITYLMEKGCALRPSLSRLDGSRETIRPSDSSSSPT